MPDSKFKITIDTLLKKSGLNAAISGLGKVRSAALSAGRAVGSIWNSRLISRFRLAATAALAAIGIGSVKAAGDMEQLRTQLETIMSTAEEAKQAFDESFNFSTRTPFTPEEIVKTRIALESVGVSGAAAVEKTATAAAAMGRNILDVASAVRSLETEPLRNLGIMLKKDGDQFLFSYRDKMKQAREITASGFGEAQQTLLDILGTRFEGGLEKMSKNLGGLWSTLIGVFKASLADFGDNYLPAVKAGIQTVIDALNNLRESGKLKEWGKSVNDALMDAAKNMTGLVEYIRKDGGVAIKDIMATTGILLRGYAKNAAQAAIGLLAKSIPILGAEFGKAVKGSLSESLEIKSNAVQQARVEFGGKAGRALPGFTELGSAFRSRVKQIENEMRRERATQAGLNLSDSVGSGAGQTDIDLAMAAFAEMGKRGNAAGQSRKENQQQRIAELARPLRGPLEAQARNLYAQQQGQESAAAAATNVYGIPSKQAMETLKNERAQTAEVAALIRAVQSGENGQISAMLDALQRVVKNQEKTAEQIRQIQSQNRTRS